MRTILILIVFSMSAYGAKALYQGERIEGGVKHCIYDYAGQRIIHTIPSGQTCPVAIDI